MPFPSGEPSWQVTDLEQLASENALQGINPEVFSAIAGGESGYEVKGAGVNSSGYGGFFGLGYGNAGTYHYGGATGSETRAQLEDPSSASFEQQAQTAAIALRSYIAQHPSDFHAALTEGFSEGDYTLAEQFLAGAAPYAGATGGSSAPSPEGGSGNATSGGGTDATLASKTTAPTTNTTQVQQTGVAGILQDVDSFLNPHLTTAGGSIPIIGSILQTPTDIETTLLEIAGRGLFTVFFLFVTLGGIYMIVKKPVNAGLGVVTQVVAPQQRIAQESRRLNISAAAENRRYVAQGLQDPGL